MPSVIRLLGGLALVGLALWLLRPAHRDRLVSRSVALRRRFGLPNDERAERVAVAALPVVLAAIGLMWIVW